MRFLCLLRLDCWPLAGLFLFPIRCAGCLLCLVSCSSGLRLPAVSPCGLLPPVSLLSIRRLPGCFSALACLSDAGFPSEIRPERTAVCPSAGVRPALPDVCPPAGARPGTPGVRKLAVPGRVCLPDICPPAETRFCRAAVCPSAGIRLCRTDA